MILGLVMCKKTAIICPLDNLFGIPDLEEGNVDIVTAAGRRFGTMELGVFLSRYPAHRFVRVNGEQEAAAELKRLRDGAATLDFGLSMFDKQLSLECKRRVALTLNELLADQFNFRYAINALVAAPLSPSADENGALHATEETPLARTFIDVALKLQPWASAASLAFSELDAADDVSEESRSHAKRTLLERGLLQDFARDERADPLEILTTIRSDAVELDEHSHAALKVFLGSMSTHLQLPVNSQRDASQSDERRSSPSVSVDGIKSTVSRSSAKQVRLLEAAESRIQTARREHWSSLNLSGWGLEELPDSIVDCTRLESLHLGQNRLQSLPKNIGRLQLLKYLTLSKNSLRMLPNSIGDLERLRSLSIEDNRLEKLPNSVGRLRNLTTLRLRGNRLREISGSVAKMGSLNTLDVRENQLTVLPTWLANLDSLKTAWSESNPLDPETLAAVLAGTSQLKAYLREYERSQKVLSEEVKLVFVGEGGVGKSSLLAALKGGNWQEKREHTQGVDRDTMELRVPSTDAIQVFNTWDFAGQPVYRSTHQIFFSAPSIFVLVWNPRYGAEKCAIRYWLNLIRRRTYSQQTGQSAVRVLVVATHGGPDHPSARLDTKALEDSFPELIAGFASVDSDPRSNEGDSDDGLGIDSFRHRLVKLAQQMSPVKREITATWNGVRAAVRKLQEGDRAHVRKSEYYALCQEHGVGDQTLADAYLRMLREFGQVIHFPDDVELDDMIVVKPEWLTEALRDLFEEPQVVDEKGLVLHSRLDTLWEKYGEGNAAKLIRLMERFELSYVVVRPDRSAEPASLIAEMVPGDRPPELESDWAKGASASDRELIQICRIEDRVTGRPDSSVESRQGGDGWAEGLIPRLIVKLHRFSLGRDNFARSQHWRGGLVISDSYNGSALIEHSGCDVRVTVRAAYPERLMHFVCEVIKDHVEFFWPGLRCRVAVPCPNPRPCGGWFDMRRVVEAEHHGNHSDQCPICENWFQTIELLRTTKPVPSLTSMLSRSEGERRQLREAIRTGFRNASRKVRELSAQVDERFHMLLSSMNDESREAPRLVTITPADKDKWADPNWTSQDVVITLWCETARLPVPVLCGDPAMGAYEARVQRSWLESVAPYSQLVAGTLKLTLPFVNPPPSVVFSEDDRNRVDDALSAQLQVFDSLVASREDISSSILANEVKIPQLVESLYLLSDASVFSQKRSEPIEATGASLREIHRQLTFSDPNRDFGGLTRRETRQGVFSWIHRSSQKSLRDTF